MNSLLPIDPADLKSLGPFRTLSDDQLAILAGLAQRRTLASGQVLFEEGAAPDALYVIERGSIKVRGRLQTGESRALATLGRGDLVGEMGIFEGRPRSVQAMAGGPTTILEISAADLNAHLTGDPAGARSLMDIVVGAVSERLRRANTQLLTLFQVGRLLGQAGDLDLILNPVLELILDGIHEAEGALLWLVNEVSGELELHGLAHGHGRTDHLRGLQSRMSYDRPTLPMGDPLVRLLERTDEGLELAEIPPASVLRPWLEGTPRVLLAPLRARARVDGALLLLDWTTEVSFTPTDADLLASIAAQLEGAIERLRHQQEQRDRLRLEQGGY